ncbi:MAG: RrF2 family transcriptional regulator [Armatimonadota bacterium]|jgi:Rrf2 family protein|nr:Rrf2 family transcriptional regulator [Fimbriimonadaceae bacterium]
MKFSAQEEFGLRCLISIAREGDDGFLTILQISEREGLSGSHVAKLLSILRKHGFVKSVRGQQGGYRMARPPQEILVRDLLEALGGRLYDSGFCLRHAGLGESCVHETDCTLRPLWGTVQNAVDRVIAMITLQDLLDGKVDSPNAVMQGLPPRRATASATSERS